MPCKRYKALVLHCTDLTRLTFPWSRTASHAYLVERSGLLINILV